LREIIADELVRIDDDRLALVTITGIDVDDELNRAHVFFDSLAGEDGDDFSPDGEGGGGSDGERAPRERDGIVP